MGVRAGCPEPGIFDASARNSGYLSEGLRAIRPSRPAACGPMREPRDYGTRRRRSGTTSEQGAYSIGEFARAEGFREQRWRTSREHSRLVAGHEEDPQPGAEHGDALG